MVTIVLVDDHKILLSGLRRSIESTGEAKVVAVAGTATEGLSKVAEFQPDLGIFDLGLPDHSGLWLIRKVRQIRPMMPILVLSMHAEIQVVSAVLQNGANGYLEKSADEKTLLAAIRSISSGECFLEERVRQQLMGSLSPSGNIKERYLDQATDRVLTSKEIEILKLTCAGHSNQVMSELLEISVSTVKSRLRSVFTKLNVQNRTEAVTAAVSLGILDEA